MTKNWQDEVLKVLQQYNDTLRAVRQDGFFLLVCKPAGLAIHLVPLINNFNPAGLIRLQADYKSMGFKLVHLWEDLWMSRRETVRGRLISALGLNQKVFARKTEIRRITQPQADQFLEENHLQGSAKARYKVALMQGDEMLAVATFSALRVMSRKHAGYKSAELIRFATKSGYTLTGGFSKLIKYFMDAYQPDDLMTYADRDWFLGESYRTLGFKLEEEIPAFDLYADPFNYKRYTLSQIKLVEGVECVGAQFIRVFNTGSFKYILHRRDGK